MFAAFGRFIDKPELEKILAMAPMTEWDAMKSFLPRRWFYSPEQERAALAEVARLAAIYSNGREQEPKER